MEIIYHPDNQNGPNLLKSVSQFSVFYFNEYQIKGSVAVQPDDAPVNSHFTKKQQKGAVEKCRLHNLSLQLRLFLYFFY